MALVDIYGAIEGPAVEGWLDCTHRGFESVMFLLLPRGFAWDREDPVMQRLVAAAATEPSRVDVRARALERELDPSTTFELVTDWEEMLGLPECAEPETLAARRAAILAKLLAQTGHDQSLGYWTELLETLGYELEWTEKGHTAMTCVDDCNDVLFTSEWEFVWSLVVNSGIDDALLVCMVNHQALIETFPIVHLLWQPATGAAGNELIRAIASSMTGQTIAVGEGGHVLVASVDASAWATVGAPSLDDFFAACECGIEGKRFVIMGTAGVAFFSDTNGATWSPGNAGAVIYDVYGLSRGHAADNVVVAVGSDGACYRSTDGGENWAAVASATSDSLYALTRCKGAMVAVGFDGQVVRSTNSGNSWLSIIGPIAAGQHLYGVSAWDLLVIAVGVGGLIRRSEDGGLTWETVASPTTQTLYAVTSSPSGRWTAAGAAGTLIQSLDGGLTWVVRETGALSDLRAAGRDWPLGRAIVAGEDGNIFVE